MQGFFLFSLLFATSLFGFTSTHIPLAICEGDTSSLAGGCVDVISGSLVITEPVLTLPGPDPQVVTVTYCSHNFDNRAWDISAFSINAPLQALVEGRDERAFISTRSGGLILLNQQGPRGNFPLFGYKEGEQYSGVTNTILGEPSGQANPLNMKVEHSKYGKSLVIEDPTGHVRMMYRIDEERGRELFQMRRERLPNGNRATYTCEQKRKSLLRECKRSADEQVYSTLKTIYTEEKISFLGDEDLQGTIPLRRTKNRDGEYDITQSSMACILRSGLPSVSFNYYDHGSSGIGLLSKRRWSGGFYQEIDYTDRKHLGKVTTLSSPVGVDHKPHVTHRFIYDDGCTGVYDAFGHKTSYKFSGQRLTKIQFYAGRAKHTTFCPHHAIQFFWGKQGTKEQANLRGRLFLDAKQRPLSAKHYKYDPETLDVTKEVLYGNLTGNCAGPFSHKKRGILEGAESYTISYEYRQDHFHLPTKKSEENGRVVLYDYVPNTNLQTKELVGTEEKILLRTFREYAENSFCTAIISDDGSGLEADDLTDVTYRLITRQTPTESFPYFLVARRENYALDLQTQQEHFLGAKEYGYDRFGNILSIRTFDATGAFCYEESFAYDQKCNCILEVDPIGRRTEREFDAACNKTVEREPDPRFVTYYSYDCANRLKEEREEHEDGVTLITTHSYNLLNQRTKTLSPYGEETRYHYDEFGNLIKVRAPKISGRIPETKRRYNASGCAAFYEDPNGHVTRTRYNARRQPTAYLHPDGSKELLRYTLDGKKRSHTKTGLTTVFTYDILDHLLREELFDAADSSLSTTTYLYKGDLLLSKTLPDGAKETFSYDSACRLIEHRTPTSCTCFSYDVLGRKARTITFDQIEEVIYDFANRISEKRLLDLNETLLSSTRYTYDAQDNIETITETTHAGSKTTTTLYNSRGELIKEIDAIGNTTTHEYLLLEEDPDHAYCEVTRDPTGLCKKTLFNAHRLPEREQTFSPTGELLLTTTHTYDRKGQEISRQDEGRFSAWTYTPMGKVSRFTRRFSEGKQITLYSYNSRGLLESTLLPDGNRLCRAYDERNRLRSLSDTNNTLSYLYSYDQRDRITEVEDLLQSTHTHRTYNHDGKILSETLASGLTLCYTHDPAGRTTQILLPDHSSIHYAYTPLGLRNVTRRDAEGEELYTHLYHDRDALGHPASVTLARNAGTLTLSYDLCGRLTSLTHPHFTESIPPEGFDPAGNLLCHSHHDPLGSLEHTYTYSPLHQLIAEGSHVSHTWTLDSLHNPLTKDALACESNALNQLTAIGESTYTYDLNGNLKEEGGTSYLYDGLGRLIEVRLPEKSICYTYDAFHRRISRSDGSKTSLYLWAGKHEVGAYEEGTLQELRVLGNGYGREVGAAVTIELQGRLYIPLHDLRGNVALLLDEEGTPTHTYRYSAYGETECTKALPYNPWQFSSKRVDPDTHLIHFGRRDYHVALERFISPDPLRYEAGVNFYSYVHANPITLLDPTGLYAVTKDWRSTAYSSAVGFGHGMGKFAYSALTFLPRMGFYAGTYCMLGRQARQQTWRAFDDLERGFTSRANTSIRNSFGVDPSDRAYSRVSHLTQTGLEFASMAVAGKELVQGTAKLAKRAVNFKSGVKLNAFHEAARNLPKTAQNNIRTLRGWAKSKGWRKLPNPEGKPEKWGGVPEKWELFDEVKY